MTSENNKVLVSLRAFEGRMKRHILTSERAEMKKCRFDSRWYAEMGPYYFVEIDTNTVQVKGLSLEALVRMAREDNVLKAYEEVESD